MGDDFDSDYVTGYVTDEEEAYFYHTLGDFEASVKELGAKYVLTEMNEDVRKLLEDAFKQC
jgi:pimeloyl-CoA synthetase